MIKGTHCFGGNGRGENWKPKTLVYRDCRQKFCSICLLKKKKEKKKKNRERERSGGGGNKTTATAKQKRQAARGHSNTSISHRLNREVTSFVNAQPTVSVSYR